MLKRILFITICAHLLLTENIYALTPEIKTYPEKIRQGDPVLIWVSGEKVTINDIKKIEWNGKSLWFFSNKSVPTAIYGIDLNQKTGNYNISVTMENGQKLQKTIFIEAREKYEAPLDIPKQMGGNTEKSATKLISNLSTENNVINNIVSVPKKYWNEKFRYPLDKIEITDEYGYSRNTVQYTIPHKGVDFKAKEGTNIYAINSGKVRLAQNLPTYGKTIAIDHGLGIISYYMHLSKIDVKNGQFIKRGQKIGLSGSSGYAIGPHLHLSIKIYGVSIDPALFLKILAD
jgi:murein DD-endopeptidase MepM/ murein hydrolase activator NlpD